MFLRRGVSPDCPVCCGDYGCCFCCPPNMCMVPQNDGEEPENFEMPPQNPYDMGGEANEVMEAGYEQGPQNHCQQLMKDASFTKKKEYVVNQDCCVRCYPAKIPDLGKKRARQKRDLSSYLKGVYRQPDEPAVEFEEPRFDMCGGSKPQKGDNANKKAVDEVNQNPKPEEIDVQMTGQPVKSRQSVTRKTSKTSPKSKKSGDKKADSSSSKGSRKHSKGSKKHSKTSKKHSKASKKKSKSGKNKSNNEKFNMEITSFNTMSDPTSLDISPNTAPPYGKNKTYVGGYNYIKIDSSVASEGDVEDNQSCINDEKKFGLISAESNGNSTKKTTNNGNFTTFKPERVSRADKLSNFNFDKALPYQSKNQMMYNSGKIVNIDSEVVKMMRLDDTKEYMSKDTFNALYSEEDEKNKLFDKMKDCIVKKESEMYPKRHEIFDEEKKTFENNYKAKEQKNIGLSNHHTTNPPNQQNMEGSYQNPSYETSGMDSQDHDLPSYSSVTSTCTDSSTVDLQTPQVLNYHVPKNLDYQKKNSLYPGFEKYQLSKNKVKINNNTPYVYKYVPPKVVSKRRKENEANRSKNIDLKKKPTILGAKELKWAKKEVEVVTNVANVVRETKKVERDAPKIQNNAAINMASDKKNNQVFLADVGEDYGNIIGRDEDRNEDNNYYNKFNSHKIEHGHGDKSYDVKYAGINSEDERRFQNCRNPDFGEKNLKFRTKKPLNSYLKNNKNGGKVSLVLEKKLYPGVKSIPFSIDMDDIKAVKKRKNDFVLESDPCKKHEQKSKFMKYFKKKINKLKN